MQSLRVKTNFRKFAQIIRKVFDFVGCPEINFLEYNRKWIGIEKIWKAKDRFAMWFTLRNTAVIITAFGKDRSVYFDLMEVARWKALHELKGIIVMYAGVGAALASTQKEV